MCISWVMTMKASGYGNYGTPCTSSSSAQIYCNFNFWMSDFLQRYRPIWYVSVQFQKKSQFKRLFHMRLPRLAVINPHREKMRHVGAECYGNIQCIEYRRRYPKSEIYTFPLGLQFYYDLIFPPETIILNSVQVLTFFRFRFRSSSS